MENFTMEHESRITAVEQSVKSAHHRIDDIQKLVESVHTIANEIKHMRKDINDVQERVDDIEQRPAKRWELMITTAITAVVSGLVGFVLAAILKL